MRNGIIGVVVGFVLAAAPNTASAQAKQGDREVLVGGNLTSTNSSFARSTNGDFVFGIGYFMTDRFEINVNPIVTISNSGGSGFASGSNTTADFGLSSSAQYFLGAKASKVKPYVGASAVFNSFKTQDRFDPVTFQTQGGSLIDNLFTAGVFGVKNYFTDRAALDLNASYGFNVSHPGDLQLLKVNVGITYLF